MREMVAFRDLMVIRVSYQRLKEYVYSRSLLTVYMLELHQT